MENSEEKEPKKNSEYTFSPKKEPKKNSKKNRKELSIDAIQECENSPEKYV